MKKILLNLFGLLFVSGAYSAQIANVEYVHKMIEQTWDITVPYNSALNSVKQIANMKYLLSTIDVANHMLNGSATTDYGNGEFATLQATDTDTVNTAVETLIVGDKTTERNYKFFLTTTPGTSSFAFSISAAGEFYVDWGDGTRNKITRTNTQNLEYSHNYSTAGTYTIKIGGKATAYNTNVSTAAIDFSSRAHNNKISSIDGSLGAIFSTLTDGSQPSFYYTFYEAYNMTASIPENLFAGISGAPASSMFEYTFYGCSGLTGAIPDGLFGNLTGAPAEGMFRSTFSGCSGLTGAIPDGLFGNLTGAPAEGMFQGTFSGCSGLTSIPENLFGNISGTADYRMFYRTFANCTSLTGPSARINGQYLYEIWPSARSSQVGDMYSGATGLDDYRCIPTAWGGGGEDCSAPTAEFTLTTTDNTDSFGFSISAAGEFYVDWGDGTVETITKPDTTNTTYSHNYGTANTYTIGLSGQATAYNTDESTAAISFDDAGFSGSIASIDGSLGAIFGTLSSDTNNQPRFYGTFYNASNMTGSIPSDLFAGISGAPASYMFNETFAYCSGLTGAIPDGLFGNLTGAPAEGMFYSTFSDCGGLTGAIPDGLFGNLTGEPADYMFRETFSECRGLTSIPENLFGNISGTANEGMFDSTFANCRSLTGPSARINGQYLYEIWPDATSSQVGNMYYNATGLDDYRCIPTVWGGAGEDCSAPTAEFTLTTTPDTSGFSFNISAAGEFVVDWGDGTVKTITKSDTTNTTYSHNYGTANTYTIGLSGQATAYNTDESTAAISFYVGYNTSAKETNIKKIASIDGSLGAIFGTLADGTQPRFNGTFYNATNMTGSIPSDLFAGISGAPAEYMFDSTFSGCSGLTGAIPDGLFGNLTGAPADYMFRSTFSGCSGLTGAIPDGLFGNLTGAPAEGMFYATFSGCSGLTGAIPDGLFGNLTGAPAQGMFYSTFDGCSGLTSIPENLFGNISGTAQDGMFSNTFSGCTSLTGPSARINGQYLYEIWPSVSGVYVGNMYAGCIGLSDYSSISYPWKPMSDNEPF